MANAKFLYRLLIPARQNIDYYSTIKLAMTFTGPKQQVIGLSQTLNLKNYC